MKSLADENYQRAYEAIVDYTHGVVSDPIWDAGNDDEPQFWTLAFKNPGLGLYTVFTRDTSEESKSALWYAMDYFTGTFAFECKPLFVNNAYAFELTLPRIIDED